ncbi:MAG: patatin-like phospholipase RssA [Gammaproteobacteria bacterium]|nr:patatin-like phospholipase RssA [Gammaproteobacteria bacterium]
MRHRKPKIGLALGSGSARGWSHIGVINALNERGIEPDIISGTSIGSLVGAAYADNKLNELEAWVRELQWHDVISYFDISLEGGFITGKKLFKFLHAHFYDKNIEELEKPFGSVATDMNTGLEVWLREGSLLTAARASASMPGLFTPVKHDERWLVDGGLVNPIPVSLCRAMGADIVIAVDLNATLMWKETTLHKTSTDNIHNDDPSLIHKLKQFKEKYWPSDVGKTLMENRDEVPSIMEVLSMSLNIMQLRISRSRMAGDPPDILITPKLSNIDMLDFHRANEMIEEGGNAVRRIENQLRFHHLIP